MLRRLYEDEIIVPELQPAQCRDLEPLTVRVAVLPQSKQRSAVWWKPVATYTRDRHGRRTAATSSSAARQHGLQVTFGQDLLYRHAERAARRVLESRELTQVTLVQSRAHHDGIIEF